MKLCFFIGHRDAPESIRPGLEQEVERHILELGVTEFVVGHYGNFDRMAANAVLRVKKHYPSVRLTMLLPYHPAERAVALPEGYDGSYYPRGLEQVPRKYAILRANRYMVEEADYLIAYAPYSVGNSRKLLEYADNREKQGSIKVTTLCCSD